MAEVACKNLCPSMPTSTDHKKLAGQARENQPASPPCLSAKIFGLLQLEFGDRSPNQVLREGCFWAV